MSNTNKNATQNGREASGHSDKCDSTQTLDFPFMITASHRPYTEEEEKSQHVWIERMMTTPFTETFLDLDFGYNDSRGEGLPYTEMTMQEFKDLSDREDTGLDPRNIKFDMGSAQFFSV